MVEGAARAVFNRRRRFGGAGLNQEDVEKAVVIIIQEGTARRTEFVEMELPGRAVRVRKRNSRFCGHIYEQGIGSRLRLGRRWNRRRRSGSTAEQEERDQ